jgi:RNA polymerase sigma factor (sigma-70 family)
MYVAWRLNTDVRDMGGNSRREDALDLTAALRELSARQRLAVNCFYYAGLTVDETAGVMRCSAGTVKSTLNDARAKLRKILEAH